MVGCNLVVLNNRMWRVGCSYVEAGGNRWWVVGSFEAVEEGFVERFVKEGE